MKTSSKAAFIVALALGFLLGVGVYFFVGVPVSYVEMPLRPYEEMVTSSTPFPLNEHPITQEDSETEIPAVSQATATRILFVGDLMLDRTVATRSRRSGNLDYPFRRLPSDWVSSFDYAVANLEGPVTDRRRPPEKSIDFQFDPAFLPVLKAQGWDAFSQANNHALDQGTLGYEDSVRRLREAGFLVFGHQVKDDEVSFATTSVNGRQIALIGFNTTDNPVDRVSAAQAIQAARVGSDLVIANMHWGAEYQSRPIASVVELSHWLIDQGVDVVIGGHPHWVQGIFEYKNRPIVYSLGNFVFDQDWSAETKRGMAIELQLNASQAHAVTLRPIPLQIDVSQPRIVEGEMYEKRMEQLANISDQTLKEQVRRGLVEFAW